MSAIDSKLWKTFLNDAASKLLIKFIEEKKMKLFNFHSILMIKSETLLKYSCRRTY